MREIKDMESLKLAQMELQQKIAIKEMELKLQANSLKEMLNPMTYINYAISRLSFIDNLVESFHKGYTTAMELIAKYRNRKEGTENVPQNDTPDNQ